MAQYIDKSALIAEIEKRYEYWREKEFNSHSIESEIRMSECQHLMILFNTLEVKDVNLEKEIEKCLKKHNMLAVGKKDFTDIAKHFFELGLSINSPITAADRGKIEKIILALNTLGKEKMISYDKEKEWLNKLKKL